VLRLSGPDAACPSGGRAAGRGLAAVVASAYEAIALARAQNDPLHVRPTAAEVTHPAALCQVIPPSAGLGESGPPRHLAPRQVPPGAVVPLIDPVDPAPQTPSSRPAPASAAKG
jgi:hypothetical protein